MTFSKRLALLGVRSVLSVSKPRGLASSYGLSGCRPFPYRQISEFTKDSNPSKNSQMETLQDSSLELINERDQYLNAYRGTKEKIRAEVEKIEAEAAKAGLIDIRPLARFHDVTKNSNSSKNSLEEHHSIFSVYLDCPEIKELRKVSAEREELENMRYALVRYRYHLKLYARYSEELNKSCEGISESVRGISADIRATSRVIAIFSAATVVLM